MRELGTLRRKEEAIMKKINRIMMVQSMVNTLVDSIKEYETFENKNGYPPMYGNSEQYNTKESIKRRIVQARAELNQLAREL
jgi:hypothetical protein